MAFEPADAWLGQSATAILIEYNAIVDHIPKSFFAKISESVTGNRGQSGLEQITGVIRLKIVINNQNSHTLVMRGFFARFAHHNVTSVTWRTKGHGLTV
jgi:hypothetical protein